MLSTTDFESKKSEHSDLWPSDVLKLLGIKQYTAQDFGLLLPESVKDIELMSRCFNDYQDYHVKGEKLTFEINYLKIIRRNF